MTTRTEMVGSNKVTFAALDLPIGEDGHSYLCEVDGPEGFGVVTVACFPAAFREPGRGIAQTALAAWRALGQVPAWAAREMAAE